MTEAPNRSPRNKRIADGKNNPKAKDPQPPIAQNGEVEPPGKGAPATARK